jgi:biotin carboxyl carrier protein
MEKMKVEVNGNDYEVEIIGRDKAVVNGKEIDLKIVDQDTITISGKQFNLDFVEEGEHSLMIVNGMTYAVSKSISDVIASKELKAPISGQIVEVSVSDANEVNRGQALIVLEAMKMENQIKSPIKGRIKEIKVKKGQFVRTGEILIIFE